MLLGSGLSGGGKGQLQYRSPNAIGFTMGPSFSGKPPLASEQAGAIGKHKVSG